MNFPMMNKSFSLKSIKMITFLGIMGIFLFPSAGMCSVFTNALNTLYDTFGEARVIVYATAGFGLIGVAVAAISGKLPWKWLAMISVALFALASAEKITMYITGAGTTTNLTSDFGSDVGDEDFRIHLGSGSDGFNYNEMSRDKTDAEFKARLSQ